MEPGAGRRFLAAMLLLLLSAGHARAEDALPEHMSTAQAADRALAADGAGDKVTLAALATRPRWKAVHLACHGFVDTERPMLSSLALTPDGGDAGRLGCLDLLGMSIDADLAVLSACETARGRVYMTEGVLGLTHPFLHAGAPRVLCSLWNVDDEATQALMLAFYERWRPKEGQGVDAATALAAQSSRGEGAPNTAIRPSPIISVTTPP